jgi:hypothetical protein
MVYGISKEDTLQQEAVENGKAAVVATENEQQRKSYGLRPREM